MIDELSRHGYRLSAGTLYPILHGMERQGYLRSRLTLDGGRRRRIYRATTVGRKALGTARQRVQELFGEMFAAGVTIRGRRSAR
jgi:DNA-binding PadR family transcriptional regulator